MNDSAISPLEKVAQRERAARLETERQLELRNTELHQALTRLEKAREDAESLVALRTEELEAANRMLTDLAFTDPLTGLANRRVFHDRVSECLKGRRPEAGPVALIMADLNDLKTINDQRGHHAGDVALQTVADTLRSVAGPYADALVARLGGDEFCVLLEGVPAIAVIKVAEEFCAKAYTELVSGVACGVVTTDLLPHQVDTATELLRIADAAQYRAKRSSSQSPVVAGFTPVEATPQYEARLRRSFRGRGLDIEHTICTAATALDALSERDVASRLFCVAEILAGMADASTWFVSRVAYGDDRFHTVGSNVSRLSDDYTQGFKAFFDDDHGYAVNEFPKSLEAAQGYVFEMRISDPDADPVELELVRAGGFTEMVMSGGSDRSGNLWLLELFGDDHSMPVATYSLAVRAATALAVSGADPDAPALLMT